MPPAPSEPEKYSIDEMMERLKGKPSEDPATEGELITRPDGTQVVRVRKRKRRTEQPKREEAKRFKRARIIQVTLALVLLLLAALVIGGAYVYANTAPYRKSITRAIAESAGATVDFQGFRVNPANANADSIELHWPAGNALKAIRLREVSGKISPLSLFGTSVHGGEVTAREANVVLQAPTANQPLCAASDHAGNIPVQFSRIFVPRFNLTAGEPSRPALKVISSEATLRLDETKNLMTLHLYRGELQVAGWPSFKIDRASMQFQGADTELIGLRIMDSQAKHGILELAGTIRPFAVDAPSTLSVKLENFSLTELLGPEFGDLIAARINTRAVETSNYLAFVPGSRSGTELDIAFKNAILSKVSIKGFPFLLSLVRTLNDKSYENPSFIDDVVGVIHRDDTVIEIRDLRLESKSRMAIKANLAVAADKALSGSMEIGLPESVAKLSLNGKIDGMLSPPRDGYRWFTLKIGGSLAHPSDNFAELYAAAKDTSPADPFEDLTQPSDR